MVLFLAADDLGMEVEEIKRETRKEKERETCSGERKSQRYSLFWVQKKYGMY